MKSVKRSREMGENIEGIVGWTLILKKEYKPWKMIFLVLHVRHFF